MRVVGTAEFYEWLNSLDLKGQAQIAARILRIEQNGHFGDAKDLGAGLAVLRWVSGRRIYFSRIYNQDGSLVLLVLGGNKNGQTKDIRKARILLQRYASA